jgi:hypothetical protein
MASSVRRRRTGIFHLNDFEAGDTAWQREPCAPDDPAGLAHRVAFNCFLCGAPLNRIRDNARQDTNEDVFPRWLQRRYDLADINVTLSDGRTKTYKEILAPACRECNNVYLSAVEDRISRAVARGFQSFDGLPKYLVFLWCAKLYYGVVQVGVQPRDGTSKVPTTSSLPPDYLKDIAWILRLLQGFRKRVLVCGPEDLPFSMLRFPLQVGKDESYYFQCRHTVEFPGIAVQMGRVGVIGVFDDFGALERLYAREYAAALDGHALHPVQFWELAGRLLYVASLHSFQTQFALIEGQEDMWIQYMPARDHEGEYSEEAAGRWAGQLARPWSKMLTDDPQELSFYNTKTKRRITTLVKPDGAFNELTIGDGYP